MKIKRQFFSIPDVCQIFGISRASVYRWIDEAYLSACYIGCRIKIPVSEIDRIIEEGQIEIERDEAE